MPGPDPPLLFHGHAIEAALCDLGGENVAADMGDMGYDRSAFGIKQARDDTGHRLAEGDAQQVGGGDIGPDDSDDLVARQVRQAGMIARQLRIKLRFVGTLGQRAGARGLICSACAMTKMRSPSALSIRPALRRTPKA